MMQSIEFHFTNILRLGGLACVRLGVLNRFIEIILFCFLNMFLILMNNSDWISNAVPTCFNLKRRFTGVTGVCIKQSYLRPFLNRNLPLKSTPSRTLYSKSLVYIFLDCHKIQLSLKGVLFKPCGSSTPSSHV